MGTQDVFNIIWGLLLLAIGYYIRSTGVTIREIAKDVRDFANEFREALRRMDDKREACQKDVAQTYASKHDLARVENDMSELYDQCAELKVDVHSAKAYVQGVKDTLSK